jgi:excisionase family DNA binding protein
MKDWAREEFLTVAEVAERLRLNPQTVRDWIDAGSLPAVRIDRRVRVLTSNLEAVLNRSYRPPDEEGIEDERSA